MNVDSVHTNAASRFVHQHDEEFSEVKSLRRAGRASSTREDVLRLKIAKDEKEWENGFCEYHPDDFLALILIL